MEDSGVDTAVRGHPCGGICLSEEPHSSSAFRRGDPEALRGKVDRSVGLLKAGRLGKGKGCWSGTRTGFLLGGAAVIPGWRSAPATLHSLFLFE